MVLAEPQRRAARGCVAELGDPARARDVAAALISERGRERGFEPRLDGGGARGASPAGAERRPGAPRPDRARHLHRRPGDRARLRRRRLGLGRRRRDPPLDPHRRRRRARAPGHAGSTTRPSAARPASTCPGTVEPMLPPALSDDACSLAPGVERLAVTVEILLGGRRRRRARPASIAAGSAPTRGSPTTSSTSIFAGRARPPERIAAPLELARRAAAALRRAPVGLGAGDLDHRAGVRVRRRRRRGRGPVGRADRGPRR